MLSEFCLEGELDCPRLFGSMGCYPGGFPDIYQRLALSFMPALMPFLPHILPDAVHMIHKRQTLITVEVKGRVSLDYCGIMT